MERYKQISLAELFELILKEDFNNIYFQNKNTALIKATNEYWGIKEFKNHKWFLREVID